MRNFLILIGLLLLLIGTSTYGTLYYAPHIAQEKAATLLESLGLKSDQLPKPETSFGSIHFTDAKLDEESFSTIKDLSIHFDLLNLILFNKINSAVISGITLTGEVSEEGHLSISGWDKLNFNLDPKIYKINSLNIKDAEIALLLPKLGGLNAKFDAQILKKQNAFELQGNITSKQKNLSFTTRLNGHITHQGLWQANFEIEQGKFDRPPIKATRITGALKINGQPFHKTNFLGDFRAGGLNLYDTPWQDAAGGIEGTLSNFQIAADMKSIGAEGIELGLNLTKEEGTPTKLSGLLHAETSSKLLTYLKNQNLLPINTKSLTTLNSDSPINVSFENITKTDTNNIMFNIKNNNEAIDIYGNIKIDSKNAYTGNIRSLPLPLSTQTQNDFSEGELLIEGHFERKKEKFSNIITSKIQNASAKIGPFDIKNLSSSTQLKNLAALNKLYTPELTCTFPIDLKHKCTLHTKLKEGHLSINDLIIDTLDGHITANKTNENTWTLKAKDINTNELLKALHIPQIKMTGLVKATIPINIENDQYIIRNGQISNNESGLIQLGEQDITNIFDGEKAELDAIRSALENFYYKQLKIDLNGPLQAPMDITIEIIGQNPKLYGTREITIKLKAKQNIEPLIQHLKNN